MSLRLYKENRRQEIRTLKSILLLSLQLNPSYQLWQFPLYKDVNLEREGL